MRAFRAKVFRKVKPSRRDILLLLVGALVMFAGIKIVNVIRTPEPLQPTSYKIAIPWLPNTVKAWKKPISEMAQKYDIDPDLIAIIMTMESGGYVAAKSPADAHGLMQVTSLTATDIASKFLKEPRTKYDLLDPRTNIEFGVAYLAYLRDEFGAPQQGPSWNETVELIAAGYNGGPGTANALEQGEGLRDTEPVIYSRDAYNMWRERHAQKSPTYERWLERGGSSLIEAAENTQQ